MVSPRFRKVTLWVLALDGKDVREIDELGKPLMTCRCVGKDASNSVIDSGAKVPYHAHYIARIKEGMLLPMDLATAQLAGVAWNPDLVLQKDTSSSDKKKSLKS
jgi:hypothetical protein